MTARERKPAASRVLMVEPEDFRYNLETGATNAFQTAPPPEVAQRLAEQALAQHHRLKGLLETNGVTVVLARSLASTPDAPFCNNWFSTHPATSDEPATLVLYPLLAENRRIERRPDLIHLLQPGYRRVIDLSLHEQTGQFLESTGSLVLDADAGTAYAALSPRTSAALAREWAGQLGYHLVTFTAVDRGGVPIYHTNVLMFVGHGLTGICLESIADPKERMGVEARLRSDGQHVLPLTQEQTAHFCGNCLALSGGAGTPLWVMSSDAWEHFSESERRMLSNHGKALYTDLSVFEQVGGGSARCLVAELF